jgi:hypothetical protein
MKRGDLRMKYRRMLRSQIVVYLGFALIEDAVDAKNSIITLSFPIL